MSLERFKKIILTQEYYKRIGLSVGCKSNWRSGCLGVGHGLYPTATTAITTTAITTTARGHPKSQLVFKQASTMNLRYASFSVLTLHAENGGCISLATWHFALASRCSRACLSVLPSRPGILSRAAKSLLFRESCACKRRVSLRRQAIPGFLGLPDDLHWCVNHAVSCTSVLLTTFGLTFALRVLFVSYGVKAHAACATPTQIDFSVNFRTHAKCQCVFFPIELVGCVVAMTT
eukprot:6481946-Amphidinium_carterae.1